LAIFLLRKRASQGRLGASIRLLEEFQCAKQPSLPRFAATIRAEDSIT
jgi:hypothetical protein